jgi:hypothetical protein
MHMRQRLRKVNERSPGKNATAMKGADEPIRCFRRTAYTITRQASVPDAKRDRIPAPRGIAPRPFP